MGAPKLNQGWIVDPWLLRHHTVGLSLAQLPPETEPYGSQPRRAMVDGGWDGRWDEYCLVAPYFRVSEHEEVCRGSCRLVWGLSFRCDLLCTFL